MQSEKSLQERKMELNLLWKTLDEARDQKVNKVELLKMRKKIYDCQDSLAEFVIRNNINENIQYKRKRNILDLVKYHLEEEENENFSQSYF